MSPRLLVLGSWDMRESALKSWAELGLDVTLVDRTASTRPGPVAHRIDEDVWDSTLSAAPSSLPARLAGSSDGVVTLAEFCTLTAARAAQDAGLPGPGVAAASVARDKLSIRRALAAAGLPGPRFAEVRDERDLAAFYDAPTAGDAVLKPADSAGSTAVFRVSSAAQATAALPEVLKWSFSGTAILEELIPGREFSVEGIVQAGETTVAAIVEKSTTAEGFVEFRHVLPARLSPEQSAALTQATADVVRAIGVQTSVVHAEFRLGPAGFVLIEIGVRPAGGLIPDLVALATGFDIYAVQAAIALGAQPPPLCRHRRVRYAGVQFATATGVVSRDVDVEPFLRRHPGVARAGQFAQAGASIGALDTNGARAGYVMAAADSRAALCATLDEAASDLATSMGLSRR
jgi:S-sulfo-L-cysteine synthase (3-phospho-L-serine-dependent)